MSAWLLSAFSFATAMSATPGPNNAMVAASGANFGFVRTLPHMLGIAVGFPIMIFAVALGAGGVLREQPAFQLGLKWVGIAYLLYLAFRIGTAAPAASGAAKRSGTAPLSFIQGALFQLVNPKAWIIAAGTAVAYTTPGTAIVPQAIVLGAIFFLVALPTLSLWTLTGVGAARLLRTPWQMRAFNLGMAALLVASLVPLLAEG